MMACVMVPAPADQPREALPISRLRGVALAQRLHKLAREAHPGELEGVLRELPAVRWTSLEVASRSWRMATGGPLDASTSEGGAAVASMVRDGFARQRALTELLKRSDPDPHVTTRAVALRALDHVEPVRSVALAYLRAMTDVQHLESALGVLLAAGQRREAPPAIGCVEMAILAAAEDNLRVLRESDDRAVRHWAWHATTRAGLAAAPELERAAETDPDIALRRWAAGQLMAQNPNVDALRLLGSRSVELRVVALSRLTDETLSADWLRELLLDPAGRVREIARYRAPRYGIDLCALYRDVLDDPRASARAVNSALEGLSLHGNRSDVPELTRLMDDRRPRVRAAAAAAVASWADAVETTALLLPVLADDSPRVATTAARMIARFGRPPALRVEASEAQPIHDELQPYWVSAQPWTRRAAWIVARSRGEWAELLAGLRVVQDEDAALSGEGVSVVRGWAQRAAVTGQPAPAVAAALDEELRRVHECGLLDRHTADLIAFTGGLTRYPPPTRSTDAAPYQRPGPGQALAAMLARLRWSRR